MMTADREQSGSWNPTQVFTLALTAAVACSGCSKSLNEERSIGGEYFPPTITRSAVLDEQSAEAETSRLASESVVSIERENWPHISFAVPNALPAHQPVYHYDLHENLVSVRSLGRYPTADSANQTTSWDAQREQVREAMFAPFIAAGDIVLWLPRAAYKRPDFSSRSGLQGPNAGAYERAPRSRESWLPEAVGEPRFPMKLTQPATLPSAVEPVPAAGIQAPSPEQSDSGPTTTPEPEEPAKPAEHIGVGDRMGSAPTGTKKP